MPFDALDPVAGRVGGIATNKVAQCAPCADFQEPAAAALVQVVDDGFPADRAVNLRGEGGAQTVGIIFELAGDA